MKIAVVTNDGQTVSQHFGRSRYYKVYQVENSEIVNVEMRQRGTGHFAPGANNHNHENHTKYDAQGRHGFGPDSMDRHASMAMEISDCDTLIAGGMGAGAYESFKSVGLDVVLTDKYNADEAVTAYAKGELANLYRERTD
jgi:predicted Fe-Mo cluster-binding NifX family protein